MHPCQKREAFLTSYPRRVCRVFLAGKLQSSHPDWLVVSNMCDRRGLRVSQKITMTNILQFCSLLPANKSRFYWAFEHICFNSSKFFTRILRMNREINKQKKVIVDLKRTSDPRKEG